MLHPGDTIHVKLNCPSTLMVNKKQCSMLINFIIVKYHASFSLILSLRSNLNLQEADFLGSLNKYPMKFFFVILLSGPTFLSEEHSQRKGENQLKCLKFFLLFNLPTPPMSVDTFLSNSISRQTHLVSNKSFTFPRRLLWMISSCRLLVTGLLP